MNLIEYRTPGTRLSVSETTYIRTNQDVYMIKPYIYIYIVKTLVQADHNSVERKAYFSEYWFKKATKHMDTCNIYIVKTLVQADHNSVEWKAYYLEYWFGKAAKHMDTCNGLHDTTDNLKRRYSKLNQPIKESSSSDRGSTE